MAEYLLGQSGDEEREQLRLSLLERHHDPDSIAALEKTGVGEGWRCLDVGAGAGSISRWLLGRGADVLATDLDVSALGDLNAQVHDITSDDVIPSPPAPFDLVHTRLLLLHLPTREAVTRRLAGLLRPGGWLVVGDIDFTPVAMQAPEAAWESVWAAYRAATEAAGWDLACGPRLASLLAGAGLADVEAREHGVTGPGGSDPLLILSLTFERLRARLLAAGADDEAITEARHLLEDPAHEFAAPVTWTAWGRRPGNGERGV